MRQEELDPYTYSETIDQLLAIEKRGNPKQQSQAKRIRNGLDSGRTTLSQAEQVIAEYTGR